MCRPVLVQKADYLVAFIFCVAIVLIFLELSIVVLARHFVTSVQSALELGDPTATTEGFLLRALLVFGTEKKEDRANHNSGLASSAPSAASSTTVSSVTLPSPPQPPPSPPSIPPLPSHHRRLPFVLPSLSQTGRRLSRRHSYQMMPSPSPRDITPDQMSVDMNDLTYARTYGERPSPEVTYPVTIPPYAHPAMTTSANDGSGIEHPDPRVNGSQSFYDQSSRRMSRP